MIHPRENSLFESSRITIFAVFDVLGVDCGVVLGAGVPAEVRSTTAYGENDVVRALIALSFPPPAHESIMKRLSCSLM